ncbi:MAG: SDR family oxidoreductase [Bacteroidia bacterium]
MQLHNKTIVITGATSGIGEALALQLANNNNTLILCARRETELQRVVALCVSKGSKAVYYCMDLSNVAEVQTVATQVLHDYPTIDVLIHNGGISQRANAIDTPLAVAQNIMNTNYWGAVVLTQTLLPTMVASNSAHIVVISSIAGKFGFYLRSSYSASKFALQGYFESLRLELLPHNIGVTIVCPGKIKTNISYNAVNESGQKHNELDPSHANAMSATDCAITIIKAVHNNKRDVYIGGKELLAVYIKQYFPKLFFHFIKKIKPV